MARPDPVDDPDRYAAEAPPVPSERCAWLLERIQSGAWRPAAKWIWPAKEDWAVHRHFGVYRWEWFKVLLPAACTRYADAGLAKTIRMPECPTAQPMPWWNRWYGNALREVCLCPPESDQPLPRVHWLNWGDGRLLFCQCGPKDTGLGGYSNGNEDGYICRDCSRGLRDGNGPGFGVRYLVCDMPCCYCGGVAKSDAQTWSAGYRLRGHPPVMAARVVTR